MITEFDELRQISRNGKDYLIQIQEREVEQTGIASLKVDTTTCLGITSRCATCIRIKCRRTGFANKHWHRQNAILPRN
ncbi:MAG: hypothetical protein ACLTGI_03805 [Hoylesella buccalis]